LEKIISESFEGRKIVLSAQSSRGRSSLGHRYTNKRAEERRSSTDWTANVIRTVPKTVLRTSGVWVTVRGTSVLESNVRPPIGLQRSSGRF
ncbi:hypothetical protein MJO29_005388, partial [Puccinia striiformis f. sp. tritici]